MRFGKGVYHQIGQSMYHWFNVMILFFQPLLILIAIILAILIYCYII